MITDKEQAVLAMYLCGNKLERVNRLIQMKIDGHITEGQFVTETLFIHGEIYATHKEIEYFLASR